MTLYFGDDDCWFLVNYMEQKLPSALLYSGSQVDIFRLLPFSDSRLNRRHTGNVHLLQAELNLSSSLANGCCQW